MEDGVRPYCLTEVTLYPLMRKEATERHARRTASAKGLLYVIRLSLWGRYDKEKNLVTPDARTQYLVPKRTIRVLLNNPPTLIPYTAKDGTQKLEMKYVFDSRDGDQLEFLDAKQEAAVMMAAAPKAVAAPAPVAVHTDPAIAAMQQQLAMLTAALLKGSGNVMPAPNPAESTMVVTEAADYSPDVATMAQEVGDVDPFAA